ncbi:MAG: metallophosphoesterase [Methanomassiliicoccales archaeon]|nr:metallophosphoesterase [Methanomassiliicoccales archaeon]
MGITMLVCAMGDVHGDQYLDLLKEGRDKLGACDLVLLAGDVTDTNDLEIYGQVLGTLRELTDAEILAVFGNEEYDSSHLEYRERFRIVFLEEESKDLRFDDLKVKVVGTTGSLDRPTWWQRTNVPDIWVRYKERLSKTSSLLEKGDADVMVLLMHYAPTYATLEGEKPSSFPEMGSLAFEGLVLERRPDLALHAHAHRGRRKAALVKRQRSLEDYSAKGSEVMVHNVSLPVVGRPTFFEIKGEESGVSVREL